MKYSPLTHRFAKWLFSYIDRYDFGIWDDGPRYANPTWKLLPGAISWPAKITRTDLEWHLTGKKESKRYFTPYRYSNYCLTCIDIDAHKGELDAVEGCQWVRNRYFPDAYLEPSQRGCHLYLLLRVEGFKPEQVNWMLGDVEAALKILFRGRFDSIPEVKGTFSIPCLKKVKIPTLDGVSVTQEHDLRRGKLISIPALPNRERDLDQLERMSVYFPLALKRVVREAGLIATSTKTDLRLPKRQAAYRGKNEDKVCEDTRTSSISVCACQCEAPSTASVAPRPTPVATTSAGRALPARDSDSAWERMQWTCFDFTVIYRRLPSVEELLLYYENLYQTHPATKHRVKRAKDALKYRSLSFDAAKAGEAGFAQAKDQLLNAIATYVTDRSHNCQTEIVDEDLALALYTVQSTSFSVKEARRQWCCGYEAFKAMATTLKAAGLTSRSFGKRNKVVACKAILERSGLIQCVDPNYLVGGKQKGISKKYTIGKNHPRYADFCRFKANIQVNYLKKISILKELTTVSPSVTDQPLWPVAAA